MVGTTAECRRPPELKRQLKPDKCFRRVLHQKDGCWLIDSQRGYGDPQPSDRDNPGQPFSLELSMQRHGDSADSGPILKMDIPFAVKLL
jgi:hypothetical protein